MQNEVSPTSPRVVSWSAEDIFHRRVASDPCVAALGMFDGVHRGHAAILDRAHSLSRHFGVQSAAITFDRLPLELLSPSMAPALLSSTQVHDRLLRRHVDQVIKVKFDATLSSLSPERFVSDVLVQAFRCQGIVVGFNYSFGHRGQGKPEHLIELGEAHRVKVFVEPPFFVGATSVSSTRVRELVANGNVEEAADLLGHPHYLDGTVVGGKALGRTLGFPTANLEYNPRLAVPADGVYATQLFHAADMQLIGCSLTAISTRPTFGSGTRTVETYVLDFAGDLYNRQVLVAFLARLRGIKRFANLTALKEQMAEDVNAAKCFFANQRLQ